MDLMDRLLDPERGCPWDREQTLDSLRPYLLEEAHEVLEVLDDPEAHRRELGDLLFQVVFHTAIRERQGHFDIDGVIEAIRSKMIRRHPHVFGALAGTTPSHEELARQWSAIKALEKRAEAERTGRDLDAAGASDVPDPLAGVPRSLPNLQRAWRLQDKAAAVGFDWPDLTGVRDKLREELGEFEAAVAAGDPDDVEAEMGDLLFVLVRYAAKVGVEPERALGRTIDKFQRRFAHVMARCHAAGIDPAEAGLEVLDGFWNEARSADNARRESPA